MIDLCDLATRCRINVVSDSGCWGLCLFLHERIEYILSQVWCLIMCTTKAQRLQTEGKPNQVFSYYIRVGFSEVGHNLVFVHLRELKAVDLVLQKADGIRQLHQVGSTRVGSTQGLDPPVQLAHKSAGSYAAVEAHGCSDLCSYTVGGTRLRCAIADLQSAKWRPFNFPCPKKLAHLHQQWTTSGAAATRCAANGRCPW
jgi:LSD1 subclass zinc finger protein